MTRMVINERTLDPVFLDDPADRGPYVDCDWEPHCLLHGDCCEEIRKAGEVCILREPESHPRCDGTLGW